MATSGCSDVWQTSVSTKAVNQLGKRHICCSCNKVGRPCRVKSASSCRHSCSSEVVMKGLLRPGRGGEEVRQLLQGLAASAATRTAAAASPACSSRGPGSWCGFCLPRPLPQLPEQPRSRHSQCDCSNAAACAAATTTSNSCSGLWLHAPPPKSPLARAVAGCWAHRALSVASRGGRSACMSEESC